MKDSSMIDDFTVGIKRRCGRPRKNKDMDVEANIGKMCGNEITDDDSNDINDVDYSSVNNKKEVEPKKKKEAEDKSQASIDAMKFYMKDIGRIGLISKEREVELAGEIHGEDLEVSERARAELTQANLRLVVKIAHDFKGMGLSLQDLIAEGNIGLMKAVGKFDPNKGAKFSSYAAWWIKQSMRRALANQGRTIRIPVQSANKINKIRVMRIRLKEEFGREATDDEVAERLSFSKRTVVGLKLASSSTFSLNDSIQQGEHGEFQDIIPDATAQTPEKIIQDREIKERIKELINNKLDARESTILKMRYGFDDDEHKSKTLEEVSKKIGRTRERVRQIQNQAKSKIKEELLRETE
jgi:RNA polymerase primary sigma factor